MEFLLSRGGRLSQHRIALSSRSPRFDLGENLLHRDRGLGRDRFEVLRKSRRIGRRRTATESV
jgi:hypothetical protein